MSAAAKPSKATRAVSLALESGADLWHDPDRDPYVDVALDGIRRTFRIRSRECRTWLSGLLYAREGAALGGQGGSDALEVLAARALHDGETRAVHVRLAEHDGAIYLDLGDTTWRSVRITADTWTVLPSIEVPVRFRRPRGLRPLPVPVVGGGGWEALRSLLHLSDDGRDWVLLVAWLVGTMHPSGPYPILGLDGEHGTGKTTTGRALRSLIDPSEAPLRSPPREDRELVIAARNGHVLGLDNLSWLPDWLSDALCRIATGGGYSARELYSDGDEVVYADRRPIILTSIEHVATRGDLADRCIPVTLPRIPEHARRTEAELHAALDRIRPVLLGDLLTAVSTGIRRRDHVRLERLPRMADYAQWVVSCEPALPWQEGAFLEAYADARAATLQTATEADPVAVAIIEMLSLIGEWKGTASELLEALDARRNDARPAKRWPETPRAMSGRVTRAAPLLRAAGIEVDQGERTPDRKRTRLIRIWPSDATDRPHRPHCPDLYSGLDQSADGPPTGRSDRPHDRPQNIPTESRRRTVTDDTDGTLRTYATLCSAGCGRSVGRPGIMCVMCQYPSAGASA